MFHVEHEILVLKRHNKNIYNYNLKEINKEIELKTIILNNL